MTTTLLNPISDAAPTGPDLSFSASFDQIAELRRFDDPTLDQGEWVRDLKSADWPGVARLCAELLSTQTKDLRLAGWMTEALAHTRSFAGMAEGLDACASLCELYWDALHPQADEDVPAHELAERFGQRIGNLGWLLSQLAELAQTLPLMRGKNAAGAPLAFGRRLIEATRARKASEFELAVEPSEEQIAQALAQTPAQALLENLAGVEAALAALARLQAVVDGQLGVQGPNFSVARNELQNTLHMLGRFAKDRGLQVQPGGTEPLPANQGEAVNEVNGAAGIHAASAPGGAPATRAQALAQLRQVAEFFRRTEPHSPVAYLADKAARWGEVPLHEWLRSVLKDQSSLAQIEELLGVQPPPSAS